MRAGDLTTPALLADAGVLDHNVAAMSAQRPGSALRPHVKAFKCTALAGLLADAGHTGFCCATVAVAPAASNSPSAIAFMPALSCSKLMPPFPPAVQAERSRSPRDLRGLRLRSG